VKLLGGSVERTKQLRVLTNSPTTVTKYYLGKCPSNDRPSPRKEADSHT